MKRESTKLRLDRLIYLPVVAAIVGLWGATAWFTNAEYGEALDRASRDLEFAVATLDVVAEANRDMLVDSEASAIQRLISRYPTASIWITDANGNLVAGQNVLGDAKDLVRADDTRGKFSVHAVLTEADALERWWLRMWLRAGILLATTIGFLLLTRFLAHALRRRAEAEQRTAEAMQRLLLRDRALEAITQGLTIADEQVPGAPIIYTNNAFAALTRYSIEEILGRGPQTFFESAVAAAAGKRAQQALLDKRPWRYEAQLKRKDGTNFLDSMNTALILAESGEVAYSVTVHEDVTEMRKREDLLVEAQKLESIGQLTGGVAHDFNNLLTAIKTNAEDLKEDLKEKPILKKQADIILRAADRGAGLVAQLMAFARKQELQPQPVDVNALLDNFTTLVRSTVPANIAIQAIKAPRLPCVYVDPGRLESALLNLCINSRDAMTGGGTITIETMLKALDAAYASENIDVTPGDYVLIAVTDTGSGMPAHVIEKAFTPFFTTKEVGKGTGLGLSMVYGFVKQSGGHAKLYSEIGLGTVVRIYLPAMGEARFSQAQSIGANGKGSILLVEDDELVSQSISDKLTALGYSVLCAGNAHEAIEVLKRTPHFDLVFSDVIMPGPMNGADLVREVRRRWPKMKVLLTSGYTESTVLGKIQLPRDIKLLSKPYSNNELAETIEEALRGAVAETHA